MRPSSLGGGRILRRTLSVRLSVRPVNGSSFLIGQRQPCGRVVSCFVYICGPHIVRAISHTSLLKLPNVRCAPFFMFTFLFCDVCFLSSRKFSAFLFRSAWNLVPPIPNVGLVNYKLCSLYRVAASASGDLNSHPERPGDLDLWHCNRGSGAECRPWHGQPSCQC